MKLTNIQLKKMLRSSGTFMIKLSHTAGLGTSISLLIDECAASYDLVVFLLREGYEIIFLGKGTSDDDIVKYLQTNKEKILVTLDVELDSRLSYHNSLLLNANMSTRENLHLIKKFTESTVPVISN